MSAWAIPIEQFLGPRDVGPSLLRMVARRARRAMNQVGEGEGQPTGSPWSPIPNRRIPSGGFTWTRFCRWSSPVDHDKSVDQIVDIAERAELRPLAINRDVAAEQRLYNEIGCATRPSFGVHAQGRRC